MDEISFARWLFTGFFFCLAGAVSFVPRSYVFRSAPDEAPWRDLRLWAYVLVAIHLLVYWVF